MPLIRLRRLPPPEARFREYQAIMAKELEAVAKTAERSRARIVANWENKPQFESKVIVERSRIRIVTRLARPKRLKSGSATTNDLWRWIDQTGTRPHTITPKRPSGVLRFPGGTYSSKTAARPARYGGPGTTTPGNPVYTKRINHPGFKPRHFSAALDRDTLKDFRNAVRRGLKKAKRAL